MTLTISVDDSQDIQFATVDGIESVRQRVRQRLLFQRGEYYLDTSDGVPYVTDILRHHYDEVLSQTVITSAIRSVDGVSDVSDVNLAFNPKTRTLTYTAIVQTIYSQSYRLEQEF